MKNHDNIFFIVGIMMLQIFVTLCLASVCLGGDILGMYNKTEKSPSFKFKHFYTFSIPTQTMMKWFLSSAHLVFCGFVLNIFDMGKRGGLFPPVMVTGQFMLRNLHVWSSSWEFDCALSLSRKELVFLIFWAEK